MKKGILIFSSLLYFLLPQISLAHSFGVSYNLPVPLWMYMYAGIATMVVSFLFVGYFFNKKSESLTYPKLNLSKFSFFGRLTHPSFLTALKIISVVLFLFTILTGLIGEDSSYSNFNMTFFWIVFVLGLTYATALFGNIYTIINPWKTITEWLVGKENQKIIKYPESFGYYPALIFYFVFIWIELLGHTTPLRLSLILIIYTILNDLGVMFLGKEIWFKYCEFFSVFFRLISKLAPIEYKSGKLYLRLPFLGLLKEKAEYFSLILFILFMLSSTAFNGFKETLPWSRFYFGYVDDVLGPILGSASYPVFETIGLLTFLGIFLGVYLLLIGLAKKTAKSSAPFQDLASCFIFSLIPIALVYNIAHYYTLIFSQGFHIINLISDPFGFGWNLFGTANSFSSIIVGANFVWHSEVAFILIGYIVSVYLAHIIALNVFPKGKEAFWSQLPMLTMMICYTMLGLWILSAPLTRN